jgi:NAD(P)-dependent dehydrogenase (short-subunit alcohol dehydrogenase family)
MVKVAIVTGSSSGIGYETSLLLARNQFTTYAAAGSPGRVFLGMTSLC